MEWLVKGQEHEFKKGEKLVIRHIDESLNNKSVVKMVEVFTGVGSNVSVVELGLNKEIMMFDFSKMSKILLVSDEEYDKNKYKKSQFTFKYSTYEKMRVIRKRDGSKYLYYLVTVDSVICDERIEVIEAKTLNKCSVAIESCSMFNTAIGCWYNLKSLYKVGLISEKFKQRKLYIEKDGLMFRIGRFPKSFERLDVFFSTMNSRHMFSISLEKMDNLEYINEPEDIKCIYCNTMLGKESEVECVEHR